MTFKELQARLERDLAAARRRRADAQASLSAARALLTDDASLATIDTAEHQARRAREDLSAADDAVSAAEGALQRLAGEMAASDAVTRDLATTRATNAPDAVGADRTWRTGSGGDPVATARASVEGQAALRSLDTLVRRGAVPARGAERAEALMRLPGQEGTVAARWAAVTSDDAYLTAFAKIARNPQQGHLEWDAREQAAFQAVQDIRGQMGALNTRTALAISGYVLPMSLDPAIILTNAGSISPLADLARRAVTMTDTWRGITSAGATAEWKGEGTQAADGTPTVAEVEIPLFASSALAIYSYELAASAMDLADQLSDVITDAVANLRAAAYVTGNGTTAPQGIVTGLAGTASEINGGGTEALAAGDPYLLQNALPARFSRGAAFLSHIATANTFRQMETTNGAHEFPELRMDPPMLLGKRWYEESNMDSGVNAAATENNYLLVYGDIAAAYTIVDQPGSIFEILPAYGANNRPTGQHRRSSGPAPGRKSSSPTPHDSSTSPPPPNPPDRRQPHPPAVQVSGGPGRKAAHHSRECFPGRAACATTAPPYISERRGRCCHVGVNGMDYLAVVPIRTCPYCRALANMRKVAEPDDIKLHNDPWVARLDRRARAAFSCDGCGKISAAFLDYKDLRHHDRDTDWYESFEAEWHPRAIGGKKFPDVPEHIASAADEAYRCHSNDAFRAAVSLSRSVVEATAKAMGITKGSLTEKIDELEARDLIRPAIKDAAHEIRHLGNETAHGDFVTPITEEESDEILQLMSEVLDEVFQSPARIAARQAARKARKDLADS